MNREIITEISADLKVKTKQVEATLKLLEEGNTIPFIARYRKEATGNLDEEQIRQIYEVYEYQVNLLKRKEDVIRLIDEKGMLTDDLKKEIMKATKLVEVEDLYRPFKEKKKTKATEAIAQGLEPLAKMCMSFPTQGSLESLASKFVNDKVKTVEDALQGAAYIIAEWISDNAFYRKWIRKTTYQKGVLKSTKKKNAEDEDKVYEMYYEFQEPVRQLKSYRVLALNRGEKEKVLNVSIDVDTAYIESYLKEKVIKNESSFVTPLVLDAIKDSYKRLIAPSIEREIRSELTEKANEVAIDNFGNNLEKLLLQPPMKEKVVLGFDPAYRTGCKLAVMDETGKMETIKVIYPHEPHNKVAEAKKVLLDLIDQYKVDIIAIGNGTASRESATFVADTIKDAERPVQYIIVNEAGASVYSASKLAISEFPDLHVEERSAISIGRRLQDPLSELVKIDPESIGVGLYQHDVPSKQLSESLDFVVTKAVNLVGVNVNTASASLLKYVAGITKRNIDKILSYRDLHGKFTSREELKKKKILSDQVYEQAIGFLRIPDAENVLDRTGIHPESYELTLALLRALDLSLSQIGTEEWNEKLSKVDQVRMKEELHTDEYTLKDIIDTLLKPNRDPRDDMPQPLLKSDVLHLEDLKKGMKLQGTVRNVVDFGVFIDIGLKNDGLAHISKLTDHYIKHPMEVVSVGDIVDCYVEDIFLDKKKVALSLIEPK
ncbi:MAG TPA: RNA-binding transcriptional accessory protein [Candidatus Fimihabitans intestinipullorum]|uniref:RNA-binding transcriptional accessory protein n=1 Tax=Candidatus Fimihabitans intestinipullorum TaxID=2840820 RepID=A0A9D1HUB9_9BACT|nr:RNA-binding transcriptional accessory protein [Candidatus Fimihabitans intestinipullorum]